MDSEKKRKLSELLTTTINTGQKDSIDNRKRDKTSLSPKRPPPTEEEVEEFFAIIRRMKAAVKTLPNSGCGRGNDDSIFAKKLMRPLEKDMHQGINVEANVFSESQIEMKRRSGNKDNLNQVTDNNHLHHVTMMVEENNAVFGSDDATKLDLNVAPTEDDI